jgi:glycosyltransferase involved in cell wall biosynthesis
MRIGLVIGRFPPQATGGAETQARLVAGYIGRSHEVTVFTRRLDDSPRVEMVRGYRVVRTRTLGVRGIRMLSDLAVSCSTIGKVENRSDVLLCFQTINSGVIGALTKITKRLPFVVWMMGRGDYQWSAGFEKARLVPWVLRRADRILVESTYIKRELYAAFEALGKSTSLAGIDSKLSIMPTIVEPGEHVGRPDGYVLFVGRLVKLKGVDLLLDAMRSVKGARLVIVGDGPERGALERAAAGLDVTFEGMLPHDEVKRRFGGATVLVQPSLTEGLPNSVMEALAHGVPVIGTAVGGIPDVVKDGETGFLLKDRDPQALGSRLDTLLRDESLWRRMSMACLDTAKTYSPELVIPRLEAVLADTVNGPRRN